MAGVQAGSLSMPRGRHLKENLYSLDSAPDLRVFLCVCVFVCECLDMCAVRVCVCTCARLEFLAHAMRWGSQSPFLNCC